jgi:hypothetical protein
MNTAQKIAYTVPEALPGEMLPPRRSIIGPLRFRGHTGSMTGRGNHCWQPARQRTDATQETHRHSLDFRRLSHD